MSAFAAGLLAPVSAPAAPPNNEVRWMQPVSKNWKFCVGTGGPPAGNPYHSANAVDIFADDTSPCFNAGVSDDVWVDAHTHTSEPVSYGFLLVVYDFDDVGDGKCDAIRVDVRVPFTNELVGSYILMHADRSQGSLWTELSFATNAWQAHHVWAGRTFQDHPSCLDPDNAFHVHAYGNGLASWVAQSTNGSLAEDGVYDWDASRKWLHRWSW